MSRKLEPHELAKLSFDQLYRISLHQMSTGVQPTASAYANNAGNPQADGITTHDTWTVIWRLGNALGRKFPIESFSLDDIISKLEALQIITDSCDNLVASTNVIARDEPENIRAVEKLLRKEHKKDFINLTPHEKAIYINIELSLFYTPTPQAPFVAAYEAIARGYKDPRQKLDEPTKRLYNHCFDAQGEAQAIADAREQYAFGIGTLLALDKNDEMKSHLSLHSTPKGVAMRFAHKYSRLAEQLREQHTQLNPELIKILSDTVFYLHGCDHVITGYMIHKYGVEMPSLGDREKVEKYLSSLGIDISKKS